MPETYQSCQKELIPIDDLGLGDFALIEEWLDRCGQNNYLNFHDQATINTYEAVDVLRQALYESQGRRERNYAMLESQLGDMIIMAMMTAVRCKVDLTKCIMLALQRLENLEFKKSGAK